MHYCSVLLKGHLSTPSEASLNKVREVTEKIHWSINIKTSSSFSRVIINSAALQRECLYQVYYLWPENCCLWFILKWDLHAHPEPSFRWPLYAFKVLQLRFIIQKEKKRPLEKPTGMNTSFHDLGVFHIIHLLLSLRNDWYDYY